IYTDYLRYLLKYTREYFRNRMVDGPTLWEAYKSTIEVVIPHPNAWGIREQTFLRNAAIEAGYVDARDALTKISFLSETEASVYFGFCCSSLSRVVDGTTFLVCDAGEEIVGITVLTLVSKYPALSLIEKRLASCIRAGAALVDLELERYLRQFLSGAGFSDEIIDEYTDEGISDFKYTLKRTVIKSCFDVCVRDILAAVDEQMRGLNVSHILLIGVFGDSPYLQQRIKKHVELRGCQLATVNDSTTKAVAEGAVLWKIAHSFHKSVPQVSWGIETSVAFDHNDPDHQHRKETASTSGETILHGRWKGLVKKNVPLDDDHAVVTIPFSLEFPSCSAELGKFELGLYGYSGDGEPVWMRNRKGNT
ncbi:hypothetical protein FRC11_013467, partial [Ceratobasidium sp. 423]